MSDLRCLSDGPSRNDGAKCSSASNMTKYMVCSGENMINIWSVTVPHVKVGKHLGLRWGWGGGGGGGGRRGSFGDVHKARK